MLNLKMLNLKEEKAIDVIKKEEYMKEERA